MNKQEQFDSNLDIQVQLQYERSLLNRRSTNARWIINIKLMKLYEANQKLDNEITDEKFNTFRDNFVIKAEKNKIKTTVG